MRFLFIVKQKKNVDTFETTIAELLARGHDVTLAIQQRDVERDRRLMERFASERFSLASCPEERGDGWRRIAPLVRATRDWAQYFQPPYARAAKLHQRALDRLLREMGSAAGFGVGDLPISAQTGTRLRDALEMIESAIPSDPLHEQFISRHAPDVLLVSPGLHFGSGQSDFIKSGRALGIPTWMLLFSWDNLSTKGALHVPPDRLFVWNSRQVREAEELHALPAERVIVVGAPRFDEFFALKSVVSRDAFFEPLGLGPQSRTILYLCSSKFIADDEVAFIRTWLSTLRRSSSPTLRECNVVVRPHPDVPLEPVGTEAETIAWPGMPQATAWVHRPFDDQRAVVVRTTYSTPQAFYECLHHADAVVALNTSAELEAGIAGRPVLTVLATGAAADGQAHTLHFDYLLREHGGFVQYAPDLATHERALTAALTENQGETIRTFVMDFLRPHGDRPVAPLLAEALIAAVSSSHPAEFATAPAAVPERDHIRVEDVESTSAMASKTLSVEGMPGPGVLATPETRKFRQRGVLRLDPMVAKWLDEVVAPGEVFYDVGAGVGTYSLTAAIRRGALAIAFEPGFAVYRTLCENVRLNDAAHSVIPLPFALTDQPGFFELEFSGATGGEHHVLRNREWRARRETMAGRQGHPVCAERLDDVVRRYRIPAPNALRINARRAAERVLAGAPDILGNPSLRSILITVGRQDEAERFATAARVAQFKNLASGGSEDFGFSLRLERAADASTGVWDRLRSVTRNRE